MVDDEEKSKAFSADEKSQIKEKITEFETWMSGNAEATKEEYEEKTNELQEAMKPFQAKFAAAGKGAEGAGADANEANDDL